MKKTLILLLMLAWTIEVNSNETQARQPDRVTSTPMETDIREYVVNWFHHLSNEQLEYSPGNKETIPMDRRNHFFIMAAMVMPRDFDYMEIIEITGIFEFTHREHISSSIIWKESSEFKNHFTKTFLMWDGHMIVLNFHSEGYLFYITVVDRARLNS